MSKGQIANPSFSAIYTNSTINIKHHFVDGSINGVVQNRADLKFTWRRLYGDMINLSISSGHQYLCSPLDWNALIQVQIQKYGILIDKSVYGPILLEQKIKEKRLQNYKIRYKAWISLDDSPICAEIVISNQSPILFQIFAGNHYFQFERDIMQKRGWDIFSCLPDSGILMIYIKNLKKKHQLIDFLEKIKLNTVGNQGNTPQVPKKSTQLEANDTLSIVFIQRVQRDDFLIKLIEQTCEIRKTKSMKHLINKTANDKTIESYHYKLHRKPSNSNQNSKRQDIQESLIEALDTQNGLGNRTMQDLFELIYTPNHSVSHTNQKHSDNSKHKSSKALNINTNSNHSQNELRKSKIQNRVNIFLTDKQSRKEKRDRKCSTSIKFKNPEEYDLRPIQFQYQYQYDPEFEVLLRNPKRIKQLLHKTRQLQYQNRQLKTEIEQLRYRQQIRQQQATKYYSTKDIQYLKQMMQQINMHITTRMMDYREKASKSSQKHLNFQNTNSKQAGKQIPYRKNFNTNWNPFRQINTQNVISNAPNFIKNIKKNKPHDFRHPNRTGDVNINNFININGQSSYCDVPLVPPSSFQLKKHQSQIKIDCSPTNSQQLKFEQQIANKNFKCPAIQTKNYEQKQQNTYMKMFKLSNYPSKKHLRTK